MNSAERFAHLFRGYTERFGRYDLSGDKSDKGKMQGRAQTVDQPITADDYAAHVSGAYGIGVVPLTSDNTVHFGAIDVDKYDGSLDHFDIAVRLRELPVLVSRSKSGGVHIWMFSEQGVPALTAINFLRWLAADLGFGGSEIFPKQAARAQSEDVGNWINLPYFGSTRTAVLVKQSGAALEQVDASLEQFLDMAEACAQADQATLERLTPVEDSQRTGADGPGLWYDGPPCLQRLFHGQPKRKATIERNYRDGNITEDQYRRQLAAIKPQLSANRNHAFFNLAIYLARRLTNNSDQGVTDKQLDEIKSEMRGISGKWAGETGEEELPAEEINKTADQGSKGKWNYKCNDVPLKEFCDRRNCLRRRFGVASVTSEPGVEISGFTRIDTDPPLWAFNVGEDASRVLLTSDQLLNQRAFRIQLLNAANVVWPMLQEGKFVEKISELQVNADRIDGPPDTKESDRIFSALISYIERKPIEKGVKDERIKSGHTLIDSAKHEARIYLPEFEKFIRATDPSLELDRRILGTRLMRDFGAQRMSTTVGGRNGSQIVAYVFDLSLLDTMKEVGDEG